MSKIKLLIFDFDGTIVDSKTVYYHAIEMHLERFGLHKQAADHLIDRGLSINETLKKLGFNFILRFITKRKIMSEVLNKVNQVKKCHDAAVIKDIKTRKILVSNSLDEFIYPVLKHLKIKDEFSEIYGADDFDDKTQFIRDYLESNWLKPEEVIYIGDRVADIKLAKKIGCLSLIVSGKCAWNPKKDIIKSHPDFIVSDLRDIKKICEK